MNRGLAYFLIFALVAVVAAAVALEASLTLNVTRCDNRDAAPDVFLAECNAFGNYEHGAIFYGLEPAAVDHLRQADVVFLGDSHMQYAFSNEVTDGFFAARGLRHFLMGFGYGEGSAFAKAVALRHGLRPRALIINANPYFTRDLSTPGDRILGRRGPLTDAEYILKQHAMTLARWGCQRLGWTCSGASPAIYRTPTTGHWRVGGFETHLTIPLVPGAKPATEARIADAARQGAVLLEAMGVAPSCVVLTGIPDGEGNFDARAISTVLAERLGTKVLNVLVPDMQSIDGTHMTPDTARRWSEAFFAQLGPLLDDCAALKQR